MADLDSEPADERLFRMLIGYRVTQCLYVVAKLGVPDHLTEGPKDSATLARETGTQPDPLFRILRALSAVGIFAMDGTKRFALTPLGERLRSDGTPSFHAFASFNGEECYRAWGDLLHAAKTGDTPFEHVFGTHHFEYLARHPEASATFHAAMAASSQVSGHPFAGYDFSAHHVVVDVGGGRGTLMALILRENPGLRGIVYDLPAAVADAPGHLAAAGVAGRCDIRTGSAFESIPSGADVYVMSRLLHDFPDEQAAVLLGRCREAMPRDGVLLLREAVLPDGPVAANRAFLDLEMLVMNGGRERTETEWHALLEGAGFTLVRVRAGAHNQELIEATPA